VKFSVPSNREAFRCSLKYPKNSSGRCWNFLAPGFDHSTK